MIISKMGGDAGKGHTALPVLNFFSVTICAPARLAAFKADWLRTTVSRGAPPPLRTFLPILTTSVSHADILTVLFCDVCVLLLMNSEIVRVCWMSYPDKPCQIGSCR